MASWRVIENTGQTLVRLLQRQVAALSLPGVQVHLATPAIFEELAGEAVPRISLFLFQISPNGEMRNMPQPLRPDGTYRRQSLPLELCYLVTPWGVRGDTVVGDTNATEEEALLLGAIMQCFYDNAEVSRADLVESPANPVWGANDSLQILMETLPPEAHYRFWDAGELGYRLSLIYRVRVTALDPADTPPAPPVTDADLEMA